MQTVATSARCSWRTYARTVKLFFVFVFSFLFSFFKSSHFFFVFFFGFCVFSLSVTATEEALLGARGSGLLLELLAALLVRSLLDETRHRRLKRLGNYE